MTFGTLVFTNMNAKLEYRMEMSLLIQWQSQLMRLRYSVLANDYTFQFLAYLYFYLFPDLTVLH